VHVRCAGLQNRFEKGVELGHIAVPLRVVTGQGGRLKR
jgi:hypothetical protein